MCEGGRTGAAGAPNLQGYLIRLQVLTATVTRGEEVLLLGVSACSVAGKQ
jgi:hypothetical protein